MRSGRILHYDILERLGAGAMGEVYLADDLTLGRRVVLKFIALADADHPAARERLALEARSLAALSHPHLARVFALETAADTPFLVMEHVDGENLAEVLTLGPLPPPVVAHLGASIAGALAHAHVHGVIHRDIKPGNILITEDGHARLADFGVAALRGLTAPAPKGTVWGTPEYMCPDQAAGSAPDARCDQYALGMVLVEALTGQRPDPAKPPGQVLAEWSTPTGEHTRPSASTGDLERVILRCVDPDLRHRFPDAAAMHAELARASRALENGATRRPLRRFAWLLAAAALGVLGAVGAALLLWPVIRARPRGGNERVVLVRPFAVGGGATTDVSVGRVFAEAVAVGLSRADDLEVLPVPRSATVAADARAADLVIDGSIVREDGVDRAELWVTDERAHRTLWRGRRLGGSRQLPYLALQFVDDIGRSLHVRPNPGYEYYLDAIRSEVLGRAPLASEALGALRRGETVAGLAATRRLVASFPREREAHVLRAYALLDAGWSTGLDASTRRELLDAIRDLHQVDPASPWPDVFTGSLHHRDGRVRDAAACFGGVLARDDLAPSARGFVLSLRGQARRDLDQNREAVADLDQAARIDPTNVTTLVIHADVLGVAGRPVEGLVSARQAIALDPEGEDCNMSMAECLGRLGRWSEALPYAERALRRRENSRNLGFHALALLHAGRIDEATAQRRRAEAATESDWGDILLARHHALADQPALAFARVRDAMRLGYADPEIQRFPEFAPYRHTREFAVLLDDMRRHWAPRAPAAGD